jgi:protein-S-isoprenylcysteine O-methyltransferase Ste14
MGLENKVPPPVVGLVIAAGMWGLAQVTPRLALPLAPRLAVAAACVAGGLAIAAAAVRAFRRAQTTLNPLTPDAATSLVATGIFRRTRNPMYVGMATWLLGWAAFLEAPVALLGPLAFAAYITRYQIVPEERALAARFGAAFEAYCRSVRRWV